MRLSNESKVGILALASIVVLVLGILYFKNSGLFNSSLIIYAKFDQVESLPKSAPVRYRGIIVGNVLDFQFDEDGKIDVTLSLQKKLRIPRSAVARIFQPGLMSAMEMELLFDELCNGEDCLKNGDFIQGVTFDGYLRNAMGVPLSVQDANLFGLIQVAKIFFVAIDSFARK